MPILDLAQRLIPELKKKTAKEWAGPCPVCGGSDRFLVWVDKNAWHCRRCDKSGDEVSFLRLFGRSCPEAHAELGKKCESINCAIKDTCHYRNGGAVSGHRPHVEPKPLQAPPAASSAGPAFEPQPAQEPRDIWRNKAAKLISHAHDELLSCPEQLRYLEGRGLDLEAVKKYRLGQLKKDIYRERTSWGLEPKPKANGKATKLWFPSGLVIPFFDAAGLPLRIRIRRAEIGQGQQRYYWVPGSGNDVPVIGSGARAFAVVESDLDALLVHHCAGDLVNVIPLGTAAAKPKAEAAEALSKALCILVALDKDDAGAKAAQWWLDAYPRAKRWPVPVGKDPGEFVEKHNGDVRAWALAGLPPGLAVEVGARRAVPLQEERVEWIKGISKGGIPYVVAETPQQLADARRAHPDAAPFLRSELKHLQNLAPKALHLILKSKLIEPEGVVVDSRSAA